MNNFYYESNSEIATDKNFLTKNINNSTIEKTEKQKIINL